MARQHEHIGFCIVWIENGPVERRAASFEVDHRRAIERDADGSLAGADELCLGRAPSAHQDLLFGEPPHVLQPFFPAIVFEHYRKPGELLDVQNHIALPFGLQQIFIAFGRFIALDHVGVVAKHHGDDISRSEVSFLILMGVAKSIAAGELW